MSARPGVIEWVFKKREGQFILACGFIALVPLYLWHCHSRVVFEAASLLLQLAGLVIALLGLLELRRKFSEAGGLFSLWWAAAPWKRGTAHDAKGVLVAPGSSLSGSTSTSSRATSGSLQDQLDSLWTNIDQLRAQGDAIKLRVEQHKGEHDQDVKDLKDAIEVRVKQSQAKVQEAVVGNPFMALCGLWVVAVATLMQLFLVVFY